MYIPSIITCYLIGTILVKVWIPGIDHTIQNSQKLWCETIQKGELRDIRILLTFWSCKAKIDSCSAVPGMCSTIGYGNSWKWEEDRGKQDNLWSQAFQPRPWLKKCILVLSLLWSICIFFFYRKIALLISTLLRPAPETTWWILWLRIALTKTAVTRTARCLLLLYDTNYSVFPSFVLVSVLNKPIVYLKLR